MFLLLTLQRKSYYSITGRRALGDVVGGANFIT